DFPWARVGLTVEVRKGQFVRSTFAKTFLFYLALLGGAFFLFYWIKNFGNTLYSAPIAGGVPVEKEKINHLLHVLLALGVVIVVARIFGFIFKLLEQPSVIGEVVGGIVLG